MGRGRLPHAVPLVLLAVLAGFLLLTGGVLRAEPMAEPGARERCPVCGMFVAKYPEWLTRMRFADNTVKYFDGVKDMMAFRFNPRAHGAEDKAVAAAWVKDYYSLEWLAAEEALYVLGSDVHGPMGHELIPFASRAAAENFRRDHKGSSILPFAEISEGLIRSLRSGQRMR